MIKLSRHKRILDFLHSEGVLEVSELARLLPEVSQVTLRRDIAELAEAGELKRTHGGATLPDAALLRNDSARLYVVAGEDYEDDLRHVDGIILPPIAGRGANAMRRQIARRNLPFLAESAEQSGGIYLGPDNKAAGYALGEAAGADLGVDRHVVLMVCQPDLANTRARAEGFEAALKATATAPIEIVRVNGQGTYRHSLRVALDAFRANPAISVVFGVNDHSVLAAMEAAQQTEAEITAYATGGESPDFVGKLADDGPLRAVAAFFPDVVGAIGIDLIADALSGTELPTAAITPHAIVTRANLREFYRTLSDGHWELRPERRDAFVGELHRPQDKGLIRKTISFMPHYPAHDWYRTMIQSMSDRADAYGLALRLTPPHKSIAAEISRLRAELALEAVDRIQPGHTVILGNGEATQCVAIELLRRVTASPAAYDGVTIITNAVDVMLRLEAAAPLKVILTSGEFQKADRCLVGPSLGALFERMRADIAFLSVSGVSAEFGLSTPDERLALANSRFVSAARRTIALADHTALGVDATHRIARVDEFHEVITDDGALPADRQRLRSAGIDVSVAGEAQDTVPLEFGPTPQWTRGG